MIPDFDENGNLPPVPQRIWWATLMQIKERFGKGKKRAMLFEHLIRLSTILRRGGCRTLYLDGSFITDKHLPSDYDCCFERHEVNNETKALIFPTPQDYAYLNWYLQETYKADIFYCDEQYDFDRIGNRPVTYLDFLQQNRGTAKGIIAIDLIKENL